MHNHDELSRAPPATLSTGCRSTVGPPLSHGDEDSAGLSARRIKGGEGYSRSAHRALPCWTKLQKTARSHRRHLGARPTKRTSEWPVVTLYCIIGRGTADGNLAQSVICAQASVRSAEGDRAGIRLSEREAMAQEGEGGKVGSTQRAVPF